MNYLQNYDKRNGNMNCIFHRTSIRKYQDKTVEQEKIETMLRAAMAAPSACNQQPWEYYVVINRDTLEQLAECSPYAGCTRLAPLAFVACYRKELIAPDYANIDMSASVENLLLEADALGLGAVWLGIAPIRERMNAVAKVLRISGDIEAFAIIPCGYPAEEKQQENRYEEERVRYIK